MRIQREVESHVRASGILPARRLAGLKDCETLFTHLQNKKLIAGKFPVRHFLATQQAIGLEELGNVYWLPGLGNPADGLTKIKSDLAPRLRLLGSGS